jgi:hypothetical protein
MGLAISPARRFTALLFKGLVVGGTSGARFPRARSIVTVPILSGHRCYARI